MSLLPRLGNYLGPEGDGRKGAFKIRVSFAGRAVRFARHLALLRHPGFGLRHDEIAPDLLVRHLADQLGLKTRVLADYAHRTQSKLEHTWKATRCLGLRGFERGDVGRALNVATEATSGTERGFAISSMIVDHFRARHIVSPAPARIERIGIAGSWVATISTSADRPSC